MDLGWVVRGGGDLLVRVLDCPDAGDVALRDGGFGGGLDEAVLWGRSAVGFEGGDQYLDLVCFE